jgi:citrate lyase subunit beta / citryl-CoA lyase
VFNDLDDADGFEAECQQGRTYGFDGKTLIHPRSRSRPATACSRPATTNSAAAREVIEAFEAAQAMAGAS